MGISERKHHIKVLEQFLHDYQEWGEDLELEKTIKYAISSLKTDEAYQLMYEGGEVFTKNEVAAMLTELQLEIKELWDSRYDIWFDNQYCIGKSDTLEEVDEVIQQKINKLGGEEDGNQ